MVDEQMKAALVYQWKRTRSPSTTHWI